MKSRARLWANWPLPSRLLVATSCALMAGCAADIEHRQGWSLIEQGQALPGVARLKHASELEPRNPKFQIDYLSQRQEAVRNLLTQAAHAVDDRQWDLAAQAYQSVLQLEAHNAVAQRGLARLDRDRRADASLARATQLLRANQLDAALDQVRQVLREWPRDPQALGLQGQIEQAMEAARLAREERHAAKAAFRRSVSLVFKDAPLKMVLEAIAHEGNINIVLDRDVRSDARTTIFVKDAVIEDVIDLILLQSQLDKRVVNGNTILVYPATPAKQRELAELKVRSFQLSNVDVAFMANILKTMIKAKDIVTDAKTNSLVIRDTADAIALAERLVTANDVPDPEVMLEVNVLEVSATRASELGIKAPTSVSLSTPSVGADGKTWTASDLRALNRGALLVSPMTGSLNLLLKDNDTQLLASPRIRTRNKEKARIMVGDKLPQITNVLTQASTSGQITPLTGSIQYIDVGLKLEVEPEVYLDGDVGIKLNLEVSNVTDTVATQSGTAYQIGTRSAQTSLRLHDGETQILGGLIRNNSSDSAQKIPGAGQLPLVGRLFSDHTTSGEKTEIVVTITPHVIRGRARPNGRDADAWSGSESSVRDSQLRLDTMAAMKTDQSVSGAGVRFSAQPAQVQPAPVQPVPGAPLAPAVVVVPASPTSAPVPQQPMPPVLQTSPPPGGQAGGTGKAP